MKASLSCATTLGAILTALILAVPAAAQVAPGGHPGYNRDEVNGCWSCHQRPYAHAGHDHMKYVSETFLQSGHANTWSTSKGRYYCSGCHAPVQADGPAAAEGEYEVPLQESEAVTCSSCHLPHDVAEVVGTRTGILEGDSLLRDETGAYTGVLNDDLPEDGDGNPVYGNWVELYPGVDNMDVLCEECHDGRSHHVAREVMYQMRHVECVDCHMPKMPVIRYALANDGNDETQVDIRMTRIHDFGFPRNAETKAAKATFSCGTEGLGCHANKSTQWAVDFINSGRIHSPIMTIDEILDFMAEAEASGDLYGLGSNPAYFLFLVEYLLDSADAKIQQGDPDGAFWFLVYAYAACDGRANFLQDLVAGPAAAELNAMILQALTDLQLI